MSISDWRFCRKFPYTNFLLLIVLIAVSASAACNIFSPKTKVKVPVRLSPLEESTKERLLSEISRLAEVKALRGDVDVKFEDNTFAESGISEKYKETGGKVVVQTPGKINLKIQLPLALGGSDIVVMTSDGEKFRVAVVCCVEEKFKRFVVGTNTADYSKLERRAKEVVGKGDEQRAISAFSSLRPQHFTDALLMRPMETGENFAYAQSEIYQEEADPSTKSAAGRVIRGYYLLDELKKGENGFSVSRRFWFDRVGGIRLARQQVFNEGVLISDITYGAEQKFGETGNASMPVQVQVTRPQERYSIKLTFTTPQAVVVGRTYETPVFQLENTWGLPEVDLDKQLQQVQTNLQAPILK